MTDAERELYAQIMEVERQQMMANPPPPPRPIEPQTIHFSELPEVAAGGRIAAEWNFYRREVGRLLAEGHEGRWVLIKGEEVIGLWDAEGEARATAAERYPLQDVLIHRILTREPVLRGGGYNRRWR